MSRLAQTWPWPALPAPAAPPLMHRLAAVCAEWVLFDRGFHPDPVGLHRREGELAREIRVLEPATWRVMTREARGVFRRG